MPLNWLMPEFTHFTQLPRRSAINIDGYAILSSTRTGIIIRRTKIRDSPFSAEWISGRPLGVISSTTEP